MRLSAYAVALSTAFFMGGAAAHADTIRTVDSSPLILAKDVQDTFDPKDFPWGLPEGRTENVTVSLGDAVLTMPVMDVEKKGDESVTVRAPELRISSDDGLASGGVGAVDVTMLIERKGGAMVANGFAEQIVLSDGEKKQARGTFDGFEFTLAASNYDLAIEAMEQDAEAGSELMRDAMQALTLSLDYSVKGLDFAIESDDMGPTGTPGTVKISSGPANASVIYGDGRFSLDANSTQNAFALDSAMPVEGTMALLSYGFDMPVEESSDPQLMQFGVELGELIVSEQIWAMADPGSNFPHALSGAKVDVGMNVILKESMFDTTARDASKAMGGEAIEPVDVTVRAIEFDGLGLDVSGKADVAMEGERPTAISAYLSVIGLSDFMANAVKAGFLPQPQAIMVEGIALQFAEEDADGGLSFDVQTRDGMVVINDNPVAPLPK